MKHFVLFFITLSCIANNAFGKVFQNFETASSLNTLTSNCWQFKGALLSGSSGTRSLSLTATTIGGVAWVKTPFIDMNTGSSIALVYKLSAVLPNGSSRSVKIYLQHVDGSTVSVTSFILDHRNAASASTMSVTSPVSGTYRFVVEISAAGNETAAVCLGSITIDGSYNYTSPYSCADQKEDPASIHYLKNFSGLLASSKTQLQWTVAENIHNNYFEVERSTDGVNFKPVAVVQASSKPAEESYAWSETAQGLTYYRLKIISKSNVRMYSNVLFFKNTPENEKGLSLLQNPIKESLRYGFVAGSNGVAKLTIYSFSGSPVFTADIKAQKGYNIIATNLPAHIRGGVYLAQLSLGADRSTARFIKE